MRHVLRNGSALALTAAVVVGSLSGSARAGTSQAGPARPVTSSVTWHPLALINGWVSAAASGTGNPAYATSGGVVYLSGSIDQSAGTNPVFAILPRAARPKRNLYIAVDFGYLVISPNGQITHYYSNNFSFASLAGVSYPNSGLTWHKLRLLNGWKSAESIWGTGDPAYAVSHGVVYLSGSAFQASGSNAALAVLPKIARPASWQYITVYTFGGTSGFLRIQPNGVVSAFTNSSESQPDAQEF